MANLVMSIRRRSVLGLPPAVVKTNFHILYSLPTPTAPRKESIDVFASETPETSAPAKKSRRIESLYNSVDLPQSTENTATEYVLADLNSYSQILKLALCPNCYKNTLKAAVKHSYGIAHQISVTCDFCGPIDESINTSQRLKTGSHRPVFDVNRRVTAAVIHMGKGFAALEQFCSIMNMKIMSNTSFNTHQCSVVTKVSQTMFWDAAHLSVRQAYVEADPQLVAEKIINIGVSFDGSWHKRGFTSNYGVAAVVDLLTGFVIDYEVLSKYCQACEINKHKMGSTSAEFTTWHKAHKPNCQKNYEGSSPGMEVAAADRLWRRSEAIGFRYTTLLSDGDAKTFSHLTKEEVYGPLVEIKKEECINHVSKRLGTALRALVAHWRAQKVTLGGRLHGSLKAETIKSLTKYCGNAI